MIRLFMFFCAAASVFITVDEAICHDPHTALYSGITAFILLGVIFYGTYSGMREALRDDREDVAESNSRLKGK